MGSNKPTWVIYLNILSTEDIWVERLEQGTQNEADLADACVNLPRTHPHGSPPKPVKEDLPDGQGGPFGGKPGDLAGLRPERHP